MSDNTKVTRIKAKDDAPKKTVSSSTKVLSAKKAVKAKKVVKKSQKNADEGKKSAFSRMLGYFTGSWFELKQVHWPTRKATWSLTLAVILFSLLLVGLIILLDTIFKYVFELIII